MGFLIWLEGLATSAWIQQSVWAYPILLCLHAVGMAVVVGVVLMLSLRVTTGWPKGLSVASFSGLLNLAWAGFVVNAVSGLLIFMSNASNLAANWTFQLKLILIVAGGLSVWFLWRTNAAVRDDPGGGVITGTARLAAVVAAIFWIGAIVSGRFIAYTLQQALYG